MTALQTVQMVIVWTALLTDHIASGVTAEKNIAQYRYYPIYANIAQFPITQYRYHSNHKEMSTGGCGISLDRDSVSKEFQSRVVLGKKGYLYTSARAARAVKRDQDPNNESALKAEPNHQCL